MEDESKCEPKIKLLIHEIDYMHASKYMETSTCRHPVGCDTASSVTACCDLEQN